MLNESIKYLLYLNWGYNFGLWTYKIKRTTNGITIEKSENRIHNLVSILIGISLLLDHIGVIVILLYYEWIKPDTNIPETALVIGVIILMLDVTGVVAFRLLRMDFLIMVLRNIYALRDIYGKEVLI